MRSFFKPKAPPPVARKETEEDEEEDTEGEEETEVEELAQSTAPLTPATDSASAEPASAAPAAAVLPGTAPAARRTQSSAEGEEEGTDEDEKDSASSQAEPTPLVAAHGHAHPPGNAELQLDASKQSPQGQPGQNLPQQAPTPLTLSPEPQGLPGNQWDEVLAAWEGSPVLGSPPPAAPSALAGTPWPPAAAPGQNAAGGMPAPGPGAAASLQSSLDADPSYSWLSTAVPLSLRATGEGSPSAISRASSSAENAENRPPVLLREASGSPLPAVLQGVRAGGALDGVGTPMALPGGARAGGAADGASAAGGGAHAAEARAELEARARREMEGSLARIETHFKAEQAARVLVEAQRDALAAELAAEQRSAAAARTAAAATAADTRRAVGARLARVETSVHHAMTAVQGVAAELRMVHAELQAIAAEQVQEGPSQQRAELAGSTPMQRRERRGSQPNEAARRMPEPRRARRSAAGVAAGRLEPQTTPPKHGARQSAANISPGNAINAGRPARGSLAKDAWNDGSGRWNK